MLHQKLLREKNINLSLLIYGVFVLRCMLCSWGGSRLIGVKIGMWLSSVLLVLIGRKIGSCPGRLWRYLIWFLCLRSIESVLNKYRTHNFTRNTSIYCKTPAIHNTGIPTFHTPIPTPNNQSNIFNYKNQRKDYIQNPTKHYCIQN